MLKASGLRDAEWSPGLKGLAFTYFTKPEHGVIGAINNVHTLLWKADKNGECRILTTFTVCVTLCWGVLCRFRSRRKRRASQRRLHFCLQIEGKLCCGGVTDDLAAIGKPKQMSISLFDAPLTDCTRATIVLAFIL